MLVDTSKTDEDQLRCQVCIIGSGAAGISLALELGNARLDIVMVTGGGYEQSNLDRILHEGTAVPTGSHEPLDENRCRVLGGATKRWGGRLVPFDSIDFESRPFIPLSGWPITYSEVKSRYSRAMVLCETVPDEFRQVQDSTGHDLPHTFGDGAIDTTMCERWSMPTDFGVKYREALTKSDHIRVLMNFHAIDLRLSRSMERVDSISLVSRSSRPLRVAADVYILAAGGIENARLLLASRSQIARGVGNQSDMVGRCYMGHLMGTYGFLRLRSAKKQKPSFYRLAKDRHGVYSRRRFRLSDQVQRNLKVANIVSFPMRPDVSDPLHGDAVLSFLYLLEALSPKNLSHRFAWNNVARHVRNCFFNNPLAWLSMAKQLWLRSRRPRLPFLLPYSSQAQDALYFQSEHTPNGNSRVLLGDQVDEFGIPRIQVQTRFLEIDFRTVIEFYRQLNLGLRSHGLGFVDYKERGLEQYLVSITTRFNSFAHHLGTTRMSVDPALGVVDPGCKVHSVRNLYVSGGSVFPTSGHANPTLTIIALALRLSDHLISKFSKLPRLSKDS